MTAPGRRGAGPVPVELREPDLPRTAKAARRDLRPGWTTGTCAAAAAKAAAAALLSGQVQERVEVPLPAGEKIAFEPGGKHLMIFGLDPKLKPRDRLRLTFKFRVAPPVEVEARLVGPADGPPGDGD